MIALIASHRFLHTGAGTKQQQNQQPISQRVSLAHFSICMASLTPQTHNQAPQSNNYNNQRGGGGGSKETEASPRETVATDFATEQPLWLLSCYGHRREGPCDLTGDVSFEEARWKFFSDRANGVPDYKLVEEFKGALAAKERELRALKRAADSNQRLPSLGGNVIREANAWLDQVMGRSPSSSNPHPGGVSVSGGPAGGGGVVFGSALRGAQQQQQQQQQPMKQSSIFGHPSPYHQPSSIFPASHQSPGPSPHQASSSVFGQTAFPPPPPMQPTSSPFGAPPPFGQQPTPPFGQQPASASFGFPQPQPTAPHTFSPPALDPPTSLFGSSAPNQGKVVWGSGLGIGLKSAFGLQSSSAFPPSSNQPSTFGVPPANSPFGSAPQSPFGQAVGSSFPSPFPAASSSFGAPAAFSPPPSASQPAASSQIGDLPNDHLEAFRAKAFVRGKIPDDPPPLELCR